VAFTKNRVVAGLVSNNDILIEFERLFKITVATGYPYYADLFVVLEKLLQAFGKEVGFATYQNVYLHSGSLYRLDRCPTSVDGKIYFCLIVSRWTGFASSAAKRPDENGYL
jgi:hypothetical protein